MKTLQLSLQSNKKTIITATVCTVYFVLMTTLAISVCQ